MTPVVHLAWGHRERAAQLVRETVMTVRGVDPGPLFHSCPRCGSIKHGRPYVDAPLHLSLAHAAEVTLLAVCESTPVGVDVETTAALRRAGAGPEWVRAEARFKAGGAGPVTMLDAASGLVAAVVSLSPAAPAVRVHAATPRTGP